MKEQCIDAKAKDKAAKGNLLLTIRPVTNSVRVKNFHVFIFMDVRETRAKKGEKKEFALRKNKRYKI